MSNTDTHFDKILYNHCPKGIPWRAIGDFSIVFYEGRLLERHIVPNGDTPCLIQRDLSVMKGNRFSSCNHMVNEGLVANKRYFEKGSILFSRIGDSLDQVGKAFIYEGDEFVLAGNDISILKHNQNPEFLIRILNSHEVRHQVIQNTYKQKTFLIEHEDLKMIMVPLPPVEIQDLVMAELEVKEREIEEQRQRNSLMGKIKTLFSEK
ncbi:type I restriction-modification system, S subunit [Mycoplasma haemofelis str. Langford 1]|uniref:Type I restriction-modification system specificity subunit n=2 Tax=Mycoplasma haemofelis TaxID=29501 RepID=F6FGF0_MYCHI|nr:restriction endonuclease subunit S [Mycoplasma haemofelis]AEG72540.1 type I restriction-modification system specificity subunit [Mycoplasma haemofelis Ohio2]CBY92224.1 type I restriction-modification system, S subunit [Mycoplasma haemofelis str. Langford 1]